MAARRRGHGGRRCEAGAPDGPAPRVGQGFVHARPLISPSHGLASGGAGFIDSHAHLADAAFDEDRDDVLARAFSAGAAAIVCIGESLDAARRAGTMSARDPARLAWTAGVHPHDTGGFDPKRDLPTLAECLDRGACALGECGLDYHYDHAPRDTQRAAFRAQLELAASMRAPVVVHTRDAEDDTRAMVADAATAGVVGVLHCFTGSPALAESALAAGWLISFSGIITFKKWTDDALLRLVPDDRLLVESDSPYLAPSPHRGRRNEPSFVPLTISRLATVRASTPEAIAALTASNARRLFVLA